MPDMFRAGDLTDDHLGSYVRTRQYEGRLRAIGGATVTGVQVLLVDGDGPLFPVLPLGEPVELLLDPP